MGSFILSCLPKKVRLLQENYGIIFLVHKDFYASGFLYYPPAQQILLQQPISTNGLSLWSLFGAVVLSGETPKAAFQRIIKKQLALKIKPEMIESVYSYFQKDMERNHSILYAEAIEKKEFPPSEEGTISAWFTFKQILKLPLAEQTKHDIVVGQRVIQAKVRKSLGERTLE